MSRYNLSTPFKDIKPMPYARTPMEKAERAERLRRIQAQTDVDSGEYRCVKKDGEDWPIVICDEEMLQTFFKDQARPVNACRPDGTYANEFRRGVTHAGQKCYAAMYLGTLELCWPACTELELIDDDIGAAVRKSTTNPWLARAWDQAVACKGTMGLDFWKRKLAKKYKNLQGNEAANRKRKGTPTLKYPPGKSREEVDDDEGADIFLPPADSAGQRIKKEFSDGMTSAEIDELYEDSDLPIPRSTDESSKRSKLNGGGYFPVRPLTPVKNEGPSYTNTPVGSSNSRSKYSLFNSININVDLSKVLVYAGKPQAKFRLDRSNLDTSPLLSKLVTFHPQIGFYLWTPELSLLNNDAWFPICEYLERGEYDPIIMLQGTEWARLESVGSDQEHDEEVVRCGKIYRNARELELAGLQDLVFRKLQTLANMGHYRPSAFLSVIKEVFVIGSKDIRQYLMHYFAEHYWDIVLARVEEAADLMKNDEELSKGVFKLMGACSCAEAKMEEQTEEQFGQHIEEKGAFEGKSQIKDDKIAVPAPSDSSRDTLQANTKDENKENAKKDGKEDISEDDKEGGNEGGKKDTKEDGEDDGKEEGKKEGKECGKEGGKEDSKDDGKEDERGYSKMSGAENAMIRMAMRDSEEGATEEELTRFMPQESQFFDAY